MHDSPSDGGEAAAGVKTVHLWHPSPSPHRYWCLRYSPRTLLGRKALAVPLCRSMSNVICAVPRTACAKIRSNRAPPPPLRKKRENREMRFDFSEIQLAHFSVFITLLQRVLSATTDIINTASYHHIVQNSECSQRALSVVIVIYNLSHIIPFLAATGSSSHHGALSRGCRLCQGHEMVGYCQPSQIWRYSVLSQ